MLRRRLYFLFLASIAFLHQEEERFALANGNFVKTSGTHFVMNGRNFYTNGFNAYWLMYMAADPSLRGNVTMAFQQALSCGMNIARTWAFRDGGYKPLQIRPGVYDEIMFQGLDFVISEARNYGIYLILGFVNYYPDLGGRRQYVQWARDQGQSVISDDDFYTNDVVKGYYKSHVKTVLTRINTSTGVAYKDDPTIFAWELINEPRCETDLSGKTLQGWLSEMAAYVKSIDNNHLLEIGHEGYYGESKKEANPGGYIVGTDFISNNQIPEIDFATVHAYPDQWLQDSNDDAQLAFLRDWSQAHIQDSNAILKKPLLLAEFGTSSKDSGYTVSKRDAVFATQYDIIYASASSGGPFGGGLFWQLLEEGMDDMRDGYEIIVSESPSTASLITRQSKRLAALN